MRISAVIVKYDTYASVKVACSHSPFNSQKFPKHLQITGTVQQFSFEWPHELIQHYKQYHARVLLNSFYLHSKQKFIMLL